jgi:hypothetical protein
MSALGYRVDEPLVFKLRDGSFDAQLTIQDPHDPDNFMEGSGANCLLRLADCIVPIIGAWIKIGFKSAPAFDTMDRIRRAEIGGKQYEIDLGLIHQYTNYRRAGATEIADHVNKTVIWMQQSHKKFHGHCEQIYIRYYYAPGGDGPQ